MFVKEYRRAFSREWSIMIYRQQDIPMKAHEIFVLGPKTPHEIWGTTSEDARIDLHKQDILVTDVEMKFLIDVMHSRIDYCIKVTVNASFMPESTDEICQKYFEDRWNHIRKVFGNVTDDEALEIAHHIEKEYLGMPGDSWHL